ncbi:DinB family protein [Arthrobacter sp. SDTb3-6]|uniref:DinB family protein n=1 Tax=Arthrobacter sp. SDTb3-6 TaxID=2713571 RepID=UPI00159E1588|nr:DinB family protein [Arthrobacter sp. SDTb3-6]NVN00778.1 DinB family protein [Arthrobacter sp. SDTb3-6]
MVSIWVESVGRCLEEALELLAAAVRDCPDELWRTPMWRVQASEIVGEVRDAGGKPVTDPAHREALVQRWSTPWSVAWHALEVFDYDLAGELDTWSPPPPFAGKPHWQTFTSLPVPWSQPEIRGYIDYCRQRVRDTLSGMTEARAVTPLPPAHRYEGRSYAWIVTSLIGHTTAHATQIRQFITNPPGSPDVLG